MVYTRLAVLYYMGAVSTSLYLTWCAVHMWVCFTHLGMLCPPGCPHPSTRTRTVRTLLYFTYSMMCCTRHRVLYLPVYNMYVVPFCVCCTHLGVLSVPTSVCCIHLCVCCTHLDVLHLSGCAVPDSVCCTWLSVLHPTGVSDGPSWMCCTPLGVLYLPVWAVPTWMCCTHLGVLYQSVKVVIWLSVSQRQFPM
jgi:hypothetical protein